MNIKDIAKLAGVSPSTVSKIVNKKDSSISQETRERVLKIVHDYNYIPYASSMQPNTSTGLMGILTNNSMANSVTNGIIMQAQEQGYAPLILNSLADEAQELKNITMLGNRQVDGIIWEPVHPQDLANWRQIEELGIPVMAIGASDPLELAKNITIIEPAYAAAAYFLTKQMLVKGHRKIACLVANSFEQTAFITGYRQALFDANIEFRDSLVLDQLKPNIQDWLLGNQVTGFIVADFYQAIELYHATLQSGLKTPQDYSLLSIYDEAESILQNYSEYISCLKMNSLQFGRYVCDSLLAKLAGSTLPQAFMESQSLNHKDSLGLPRGNEKPKILVVGNINMDTYLYSTKLPHSGSTNFLSNLSKRPGGKGLNQAIGLAKLDQHVRLISCIGSDIDATKAFQELKRSSVNTTGVFRSQANGTGQAYIFVEASGDSMISILPGANAELSPKMVAEKETLFKEARFCLVQTEIPIETVEAACSLAKKFGLTTFLKPSASKLIPDTLLAKIDYFIPNEEELNALCPDLDAIELQAETLLAKGVKHVIVTLGKRGCFLKNAQTTKYFPAADFSAIDTTGASDAFISALSAYLLKGLSIEKAICIATYAAGFSVARDGVANSLIDRVTLESYIAKKEPNLLKKNSPAD